MFKIKWNTNHSLPVDLIKNLNQFMNVSDSIKPDDELVYWHFLGHLKSTDPTYFAICKQQMVVKSFLLHCNKTPQ
jgi:hypothetical protein